MPFKRENIQVFWIRAILSIQNKELLRLPESVLIFKNPESEIYFETCYSVPLPVSPAGNKVFAVSRSRMNSSE